MKTKQFTISKINFVNPLFRFTNHFYIAVNKGEDFPYRFLRKDGKIYDTCGEDGYYIDMKSACDALIKYESLNND